MVCTHDDQGIIHDDLHTRCCTPAASQFLKPFFVGCRLARWCFCRGNTHVVITVTEVLPCCGYIFSAALRCFFHCDGFLGVFCNRNRIFLCNISGFYGNIAVSFFCLQCVYTVLCFQLFAVSIFQCDHCICRICFQCQFYGFFSQNMNLVFSCLRRCIFHCCFDGDHSLISAQRN